MQEINQPRKRNFYNDLSLWLLLFSNLVTIILAVKEGWDLTTVMWIYWWQSITIGFFNFIRILQLKEFSTKGFKIGGVPAQPTARTKFSTAFFFLIHYGGFHFGYMIFLAAGVISAGPNRPAAPPLDWGLVILAALVFFLNHLFSYFYNRPRDTKEQNIGTLMFYPYARIIPLHLTIIFGGWVNIFFFTVRAGSASSFFFFSQISILVFFLLLKTLADCIMHFVEHSMMRKGEVQTV